ncbi:S9 family peptidase [Sphingomonas sp. SFZ2018-12]|uniref:S9 family peptidase n=1 Tax=Sphingomonas sp. SFZ2018-12 TaxID=2683197 RepID=UPI001F0FFC9A|nr:S9 family peptidase [Sphingomonas sp. SFZ2018-12]
MRRIALGLLLVAGSASAQTNDPIFLPEDVVRAAPVTLRGADNAAADVARFLLVRSARNPVLSADGRTIAYLSDVTGVPQIWAVPATGGVPDQLTYGSGVDWIEAAPGGGWLYGADTDGDERVGMYWLSADGTREREVIAKTPAFRQFGTWSPDGQRFAYASTERNGRDFDIHVADTATGRSRLVFEGKGGFYPVAWQPGGDRVVVSETRGGQGNNLYLLDIATGRAEPLFKPRDTAEYIGAEFSPDGKSLYLASNEGSDHHRLIRYDIATRRTTVLADPGRDIDGVTLGADGRYLAWTTIETGFSHLHVRDLSTGRDVTVPDLPRGVFTMRFAAGAPVLVINANGPTTAGEVRVWRVPDAQATVAVPADTPGLDLATMVVPEPVAFPARDGAPLTGLLYMPRLAAGAPLPPVYLKVHGGPSAYAAPTFSAETQYYVSRGIAVLDFNYRGSTGQGKAFAELNDREKKVDEVGDLADAVAWLKSTGRVDASRVAVGGGSYGGYLTNQALGTYPDLFIAGVSAVGVSDWVTALEGASPALKAADRLEFGDIADPRVRAFFAKLSPINNVDKIKAPLLVMHGANDPRDPVSESDRLVAGIRANGGQVTYLRFPDEGHGIARLNNRVHAYRRVAEFLEQRYAQARGGQ